MRRGRSGWKAVQRAGVLRVQVLAMQRQRLLARRWTFPDEPDLANQSHRLRFVGEVLCQPLQIQIRVSRAVYDSAERAAPCGHCGGKPGARGSDRTSRDRNPVEKSRMTCGRVIVCTAVCW